ncbi:hypothetical protein BV25DRAFT_1826551 [Artomyces pyxidatus]|uniref:Uncharacterized protein n=1 Tax=Artomyces pyxidatus TaxID=48021 RepID=A0ACB8SXV9_9AGAM|nr:hypothetical protein BV25DRAFT_1826551 [Artomyces pyxidatus]
MTCAVHDLVERQETIPASSQAWPSGEDVNPFISHIPTRDPFPSILQGHPGIGTSPSISVTPLAEICYREDAVANIRPMSSVTGRESDYFSKCAGCVDRFQRRGRVFCRLRRCSSVRHT